jgi:hypothetical protein
LGIGNPLWGPKFNNLLSTDGLVYAAPNGVSVYQQNWGCSGRPPIEQDGGAGIAGSHFDEECFGDELMTGWLPTTSAAPQPLSKLTIAVLDDSGYSVDYSQADSYSKCCFGRRRGLRSSVRSLNIGNGNGQGQKKVISPAGHQRAVAYGKEKLKEARLAPGQARRVDGNPGLDHVDGNGVIHVGDLLTTVFYMEDDVIFDVEVFAE